MWQIEHHTADVRLRVEAPTLEALFADAVAGLSAVMESREGPAPVRRTIEIDDSADTTSLLVDFLGAVLHRAHVGGERFDTVRFTRFEPCSLAAELTGTAPATFEEDVKAVTYHEAEIVRSGEGWATMLVLDI